MTDGPVHPPSSAGGPIGANPSFFDLLRRSRPEALPVAWGSDALTLPHGTTVVGLKFADGVVFAGDRRATEGYAIADDKMEKVFAADRFSVIAIAGAAGQAVEIVKLFQLELEHYEKITGDRLSLEGKANRLGQMIRGNLPLAVQGLVVVPLFAGYDTRRRTGRIFRYDVTGGRWEDEDYYATGSGGKDARGSLKKRYRAEMDAATAVDVLVEALYDAADEDAGTGGPDLVRGIFPLVATVTDGGYRRLHDDEVRKAAERIVAARARGEG